MRMRVLLGYFVSPFFVMFHLLHLVREVSFWTWRVLTSRGSVREQEQELLQWVRKRVTDMQVEDLDKSWKDGTVLCILLEKIKPGTLPHYKYLSSINGASNCRLALRLSSTSLGVHTDVTAQDLLKADRDKIITLLWKLRTKWEETQKDGEESEGSRQGGVACSDPQVVVRGYGLHHAVQGSGWSHFSISCSPHPPLQVKVVFSCPLHYQPLREATDADGHRAGSDRDGSDRVGSDRDGSDSDGSDRDGSDSDGRDSDGNDSDGSEVWQASHQCVLLAIRGGSKGEVSGHQLGVESDVTGECPLEVTYQHTSSQCLHVSYRCSVSGRLRVAVVQVGCRGEERQVEAGPWDVVVQPGRPQVYKVPPWDIAWGGRNSYKARARKTGYRVLKRTVINSQELMSRHDDDDLWSLFGQDTSGPGMPLKSLASSKDSQSFQDNAGSSQDGGLTDDQRMKLLDSVRRHRNSRASLGHLETVPIRRRASRNNVSDAQPCRNQGRKKKLERTVSVPSTIIRECRRPTSLELFDISPIKNDPEVATKIKEDTSNHTGTDAIVSKEDQAQILKPNVVHENLPEPSLDHNPPNRVKPLLTLKDIPQMHSEECKERRRTYASNSPTLWRTVEFDLNDNDYIQSKEELMKQERGGFSPTSVQPSNINHSHSTYRSCIVVAVKCTKDEATQCSFAHNEGKQMNIYRNHLSLMSHTVTAYTPVTVSIHVSIHPTEWALSGDCSSSSDSGVTSKPSVDPDDDDDLNDLRSLLDYWHDRLGLTQDKEKQVTPNNHHHLFRDFTYCLQCRGAHTQLLKY